MKIPPALLALDALGAVLLGVGLAERFAGTDMMPADLRFPDYDIAMILVGLALMVPLLKHIITQAATRTRNHRP